MKKLDTDTEHIVLQRLLTSSGFATSKLGSATRGTLKVEPAEDLRDLFGKTYWRMEAHVLASQVCNDRQQATVSYPATWWQHLKHDLPGYLGRRVRRRWPVRLAKAVMAVDFTSFDTYPRADLQMPELGIPVQLDQMFMTELMTDGPGVVAAVAGSVSRQREYARDYELQNYLQREISRELAARLGFDYYLGSLADPPKYPHPSVIIDEVMKALGRCQVNTSELVRRHSLERRD